MVGGGDAAVALDCLHECHASSPLLSVPTRDLLHFIGQVKYILGVTDIGVRAQDWCDPSDAAAAFAEHGAALGRDPHSGGCPDWQSPASQPVGINRKTVGWNAAAACFAYGFGMLGLQGYRYVGAGETPLRHGLCNCASRRI